MDVKGIFTDGEFGVISDEPLKVGNILHKAVINVDTEGTEAAAATGSLFLLVESSTLVLVFTRAPFSGIAQGSRVRIEQ